MEASISALTTAADAVAEQKDDEPYFHIEVVEEVESKDEKTARREREERDLFRSVSEGSFERLRDDPLCIELPRGMPLDAYVPGAEIVFSDEPTGSD